MLKSSLSVMSVNPFIPNCNIKYDEEKDHKYVYILCLSNDFEPCLPNKNKIKLFYDPDCDIDELKKYANLLSLMRAPICISKIDNIKNGLILVNNTILKYFNHEEYELDKNVFVYLMLESKERNVKKWLKTYESQNIIDKFIGQKIAEADQIWMAVIGPDTGAKGEVKGQCQYYQNQVAKTMAAFLGLNFTSDKSIGDTMQPMLSAK